ncbi:MAG: Gfo/Idh/MocA family oxidoreductase [Saprospiraceae bacterium]|nr:Gfo/Idh/MocA family oxidoreductase [Saprospiraceae bacterium]
MYNIGIIGYGGFGKFLHNAWNQLGEVRVVAVAEKDAAKMQGLDGVKTYTNWHDMLHDPEVDVVAIVTEPSTHETIATACLEVGKHILIEKPLAVNMADAQKILEIRDQTGMVAGIDFIMRFNPLLEAIRDLTQKGVFGKLRRVDVENYAQDEALLPSHWFWDIGRSGGILVEHAVHFIDLVHFISSAKVLAVNGLKHNRNPGQEDQIMANVLYDDGLIATHYHAFTRPGFFEVTKIKLAYDLADVELHGWIPLSAEVKALVGPATRTSLFEHPLFKMNTLTPIEKASDESRPAGWGPLDSSKDETRKTVRSGGIAYEANEIVQGILSLGKTKQEVYIDCVQASLLDVLAKISDPNHNLTAPLEAGLVSLGIAVTASDSARSYV